MDFNNSSPFGVSSAESELLKWRTLDKAISIESIVFSKAGNEKGEEFYEVELTLDELAKYLFDDLNLPDLEKKSDASVLAEKIKRKGR